MAYRPNRSTENSDLQGYHGDTRAVMRPSCVFQVATVGSSLFILVARGLKPSSNRHSPRLEYFIESSWMQIEMAIQLFHECGCNRSRTWSLGSVTNSVPTRSTSPASVMASGYTARASTSYVSPDRCLGTSGNIRYWGVSCEHTRLRSSGAF